MRADIHEDRIVVSVVRYSPAGSKFAGSSTQSFDVRQDRVIVSAALEAHIEALAAELARR